MKRAPVAALVALLALAGCRDMGLAGNLPLEEAERMPPPALVAAVFAESPAGGEDLVIDGRLWVPWGLPVALDAGELRAVGSSHGRTVHARAWDRSPYDALFIPADTDGWQGHAPVIGR
jgi:hypothetical protein